MKKFSVVQGKCLIIMIFVSLLIIIPAKYLWAEDQSNPIDCSQLENEKDRLECYDKIARQKFDKAAPTIAGTDETWELDSDNESYLSKLWELDEDKSRGKYALMMHRSNYILPFSYNSSPNEEPFQANSTGEDIEKTEVKFQLSLKVKLWQDIFGKDVDLWFGYTQKSFWQLYDFAESSQIAGHGCPYDHRRL